MGTCCSKTTDRQSDLDLNSNPEQVDVKKQLQKIKEEITNPILTNDSFSSDRAISRFHESKLDEDYRKFCQDIVKEFNFVRADPKSFLKKIGHYEQFIKHSDSYIMLEYENASYRLNSSHAFEELSIMLDSTTDLAPLELRQELQILIPDGPSMVKNYDYIANQFVMKKIVLANKYTHFSFHLSRGSLNAELSTFLQLLDDASINRQRRNNILNENFCSIGVSIARIEENSFLCYIVFAG